MPVQTNTVQALQLAAQHIIEARTLTATGQLVVVSNDSLSN